MESKYSNISKSNLEILPNELFVLIFSYMKTEMIIQAFFNLNQRFQSVILQYARHFILSPNTRTKWIMEYMLPIYNQLETIKMSVQHITSVFSYKYSYPNLRLITIYLNVEWQVELNIENESPLAAIISTMNVLGNCAFERVRRDFSHLFNLNQISNLNKNIINYDIDNISPCSAIRRVWILECYEENLLKLYSLVPKLTYLKVWFRFSRTHNFHLNVIPTQIIRPMNSIELYIKITDMQSFENVSLFIKHCQPSLKRLTFDLRLDVMTDGRKLETLLAPCTSLEYFSFIMQLTKKQINVSNLLRSFQSEWWLDIRRSAILIHETDFDHILIVSVPCSFSHIGKYFQFSSNLHSWHLNKDKFDSPLIRFIKMNKISLSNKQPISLDFLKFAGSIFYSQRQILECNYWGLMFEDVLFERFMEKSMVEIILPNVVRFKITNVKGLSPLTLAVWLLLAPNVRILQIEYMTFGETIEWMTELNDALMMSDQRLKIIFQQIQKITISYVCCNFNTKSKLQMHSILAKIFPVAVID